MIKGKLYSVQLHGTTLQLIVPDQSGDRLFEFARLAYAEQLQQWEIGDQDREEVAAGAYVGGVSYEGDVYIDARVIDHA